MAPTTPTTGSPWPTRARSWCRGWDHFGRAGRQNMVIGVPGTYPPPVDGVSSATYSRRTDGRLPATAVAGEEIERLVGTYRVDVRASATTTATASSSTSMQ